MHKRTYLSSFIKEKVIAGVNGKKQVYKKTHHKMKSYKMIVLLHGIHFICIKYYLFEIKYQH